MRVAVFGASGRAGAELVDVLRERAHTRVTALSSTDCDIADFEAVMNTVFAIGPELVVNSAGMTSVDLCESDPDRAYAVNALGARNVALAARRLGARLVHMSTDYVFDGALGRAYDEWDEPRPLSVYGKSKYGGECEALTACPDAVVVRSGPLLSVKPPNFALAIVSAAEREGPLQVVGNNIGSPTHVTHLAESVVEIARSGRSGVFHVAGAGRCSREELARELLVRIGDDPDRVRVVPAQAMQSEYPAPRPANSALDGRAFRLAGFEPLPSWQEGVHRFVEDLGVPARPADAEAAGAASADDGAGLGSGVDAAGSRAGAPAQAEV